MAVIWILGGITKTMVKGRCPLCLRKEDVKKFLNCPERRNWRKKNLSKK
jgi:hypothetical protein